MKLKALKPRLYNLMFHTHTVSGIVISFTLFVIFYTGAFSLFRDELYKWENPLARFETKKNIDFDGTINLVENHIKQTGIFKSITITPPSKENPFVKFRGSYKEPQNKKKSVLYHINPFTKKVYEFTHSINDSKSLTYMADTIYRLHYFRQIPLIGIYLAGLVAFFFLFAIVTGILIHWKNISNKFYDFRVNGKWKQIWKNTHTILGTITIPFQIIFAITGAFLGLSVFLLAPSAYLLYNGDTNKILKHIRPNTIRKYDKNAKDVTSKLTINQLYKQVSKQYSNHHIENVKIGNLGKEDGTILFKIDDKKGISGNGEFLYSYKDGRLLGDSILPNKKSYPKGAFGILVKLHYANFGGYLLKIIYFILAMLTCYVISSGVMIWKTARNNSKYTAKQQQFHHKVTKYYLAFTSSLFPAIALIFIANKVFPITMEYRVTYVKSTFFIGWLVFTILGLFWNNYAKLNRNYIFIGSLLALLIPFSNGLVTGDWF